MLDRVPEGMVALDIRKNEIFHERHEGLARVGPQTTCSGYFSVRGGILRPLDYSKKVRIAKPTHNCGLLHAPGTAIVYGGTPLRRLFERLPESYSWNSVFGRTTFCGLESKFFPAVIGRN